MGCPLSTIHSIQIAVHCNFWIFLGAFHKRRPHLCSQGEEGLSSADKGGLQMRTSALFRAKNMGFFEIYGKSARTRGRGGQFFAIFVRTSFMDGHLKVNKLRFPYFRKLTNGTADHVLNKRQLIFF